MRGGLRRGDEFPEPTSGIPLGPASPGGGIMKPLQTRIDNVATGENIRTRIRTHLVVVTTTSFRITTGKFRHGLPLSLFILRESRVVPCVRSLGVVEIGIWVSLL